MKNRIPAVGARYAAFCVVFLMIQFAVALLLRLTVPDVVRAYKTSISYGLVVLAVDLIGFPFVWLLMSGIPKTKIEQHKLSFPEWFGFLCMTEGLMIAGSLIGNPIHTALTQPFSGDSITNASNLMENSNVILRTLVVGIGAPVFEELIFRKVLIDRTVKYGEYISIVMSGVMFGLLHGNFSQFFFATFVGMLFAYVYIRTGRIRYTIFLHMAVNLSSALVLQTLLQKLLQANSTGDTHSAETAIYALIALAWIGGVFAIAIIGIVKLIKSLKRKRLKLKMMKGEPTHKEVRKLLLSDKALWLYLAMTILLFLDSYLPNIIVFLMGRFN
jgi:membrane protease YdiL (CAAX protease family)